MSAQKEADWLLRELACLELCPKTSVGEGVVHEPTQTPHIFSKYIANKNAIYLLSIIKTNTILMFIVIMKRQEKRTIHFVLPN